MKPKSLFAALMLLFCATSLWASDTSVDGIWYDFDNSTMTATVTYRGSSYDAYSHEYSGNVSIPASVTYSGKTYSVTSIGEWAFSYCSGLTSVTIPNCVINIGYAAFYKCSLTSPVYNAHLFASMPISYSGAYTIPNGIESIAWGAFSHCETLTSVTIPNSVTSIGNDAFACSGLTSIEIPNSVTSIGNHAFNQCYGLTSVTIGNSVTGIEYSTFYQCRSLTSVTIGNSVTSIGGGAFRDCRSLTSVTIPNSVTSIGGSAFSGCSGLTSVTIGNSVTSIGESAFSGCSGLTSVTIPNCVTSIGERTFYNCSSLTSVTIPNSVTNVGNSAFEGCSSLISLTINGDTNFGGTAFRYCSNLTNVTYGNNVTIIKGNGAFSSCNIKNIIIGLNVKIIEEKAFADCKAIETITCYSMRPPIPTMNNGAFDLPYSTIIYVPADYLNTYKMHDFWGLYDVRPIGAATTVTTEVNVEPTTTTADIVWPIVEGAATYELVIKDKNGNVVCTLIFNANGQLTQIAFFSAPARDNAMQTAGFSFTVTGLEEGTSYDLTITAKDGNGTTLDEKTIAFTTAGSTDADALQVDKQHSSKVIRNGQLFIQKAGKTYTLQGIEVK